MIALSLINIALPLFAGYQPGNPKYRVTISDSPPNLISSAGLRATIHPDSLLKCALHSKPDLMGNSSTMALSYIHGTFIQDGTCANPHLPTAPILSVSQLWAIHRPTSPPAELSLLWLASTALLLLFEACQYLAAKAWTVYYRHRSRTRELQFDSMNAAVDIFSEYDQDDDLPDQSAIDTDSQSVISSSPVTIRSGSGMIPQPSVFCFFDESVTDSQQYFAELSRRTVVEFVPPRQQLDTELQKDDEQFRCPFSSPAPTPVELFSLDFSHCQSHNDDSPDDPVASLGEDNSEAHELTAPPSPIVYSWTTIQGASQTIMLPPAQADDSTSHLKLHLGYAVAPPDLESGGVATVPSTPVVENLELLDEGGNVTDCEGNVPNTDSLGVTPEKAVTYRPLMIASCRYRTQSEGDILRRPSHFKYEEEPELDVAVPSSAQSNEAPPRTAVTVDDKLEDTLPVDHEGTSTSANLVVPNSSRSSKRRHRKGKGKAPSISHC
ncbi:hypothetical protein DXG03_000573 [Asterophora parasitica]|uniref:Uncharacterized protein n=1 Tax=Asterophora parasitica TaxID=117018 RepID=A0A9P7GAU5_9AGAR|nr:hypothetical protein DXG03_000573 [Asterophora parasitica]